MPSPVRNFQIIIPGSRLQSCGDINLKPSPTRKSMMHSGHGPFCSFLRKKPFLISLLLIPGLLRATCLKIRQRSPRRCLRPHLTFMVCPQKAPLVPYSVGGTLPTPGNLNFTDIHLGIEIHISIQSYTLEISYNWKVKTGIMRLSGPCLPPGQERAHPLGHWQPGQWPVARPDEVAESTGFLGAWLIPGRTDRLPLSSQGWTVLPGKGQVLPRSSSSPTHMVP